MSFRPGFFIPARFTTVAHAVSAAVLGVLLGVMSWGENHYPVLMLILPLAWSMLPGGMGRASWIVGYYAGAIVPLSEPLGMLMQDIGIAVAPWLIASFAISGDRTPAATGDRSIKDLFRGPWYKGGVAALATVCSSFGLASPLLGVGWLFPGGGLTGVMAYLLFLCMACLAWPRFVRYGPIALLLLISFSIPYVPAYATSTDQIFARSMTGSTLGQTNVEHVQLISQDIPAAAAVGVKLIIYPGCFLSDNGALDGNLDRDFTRNVNHYGVAVAAGVRSKSHRGCATAILLEPGKPPIHVSMPANQKAGGHNLLFFDGTSPGPAAELLRAIYLDAPETLVNLEPYPLMSNLSSQAAIESLEGMARLFHLKLIQA